MSGGEQQMLTVARTLMGNPLLVALDEPSEGVAPIVAEQMANTILALKRQGMSILLAEQNLIFAQLICDRVYVLEKGSVRWTGYFREPSGPGWVLTGDAGHFKDPGPGRGIGDAFIQADA